MCYENSNLDRRSSNLCKDLSVFKPSLKEPRIISFIPSSLFIYYTPSKMWYLFTHVNPPRSNIAPSLTTWEHLLSFSELQRFRRVYCINTWNKIHLFSLHFSWKLPTVGFSLSLQGFVLQLYLMPKNLINLGLWSLFVTFYI